MTVAEVWMKEYQSGRVLVKDAMYNIGFEHDGYTDETQFDIYGGKIGTEVMEELVVLFRDFCRDNGYDENSVVYIEYAGPIL